MKGGRGRRVKEAVDEKADDGLRSGREGEMGGKREGEGEG